MSCCRSSPFTNIYAVILRTCNLLSSRAPFFRCIQTIRVHDCCPLCTDRSFSSLRHRNCTTTSWTASLKEAHFACKKCIKRKKKTTNSIPQSYLISLLSSVNCSWSTRSTLLTMIKSARATCLQREIQLNMYRSLYLNKR